MAIKGRVSFNRKSISRIFSRNISASLIDVELLIIIEIIKTL